jgi:prepilin-type N-terminal cleavage/methylation domain-containing protein
MMNEPTAFSERRTGEAPAATSSSRVRTNDHNHAFSRCAILSHDAPAARPRRLAAPRAFTLTELMVAVIVLLVVIVATSKIFGTASQVTRMGQATAALLQEAAAIEQQIRQDISRLTNEGFFVIHCVAVRNDVRGSSYPLLDPNRPNDAIIRADQLLFFANGVQGIQTFRHSTPGGTFPVGSNHKGQGTVSRVLYSHAFQTTNSLPVTFLNNGAQVRAHDPNLPAISGAFSWLTQVPPWFPDSLARPPAAPTAYSPQYNMIRTVFQSDNGDTPADYSIIGPATPLNILQPASKQWLLARQALVLADDDSQTSPTAPQKSVFLFNNRSAFTLVDPVVRNGRVDAIAQQLNDIRRSVIGAAGTQLWTVQRPTMQSATYYPRAERKAPGMHRVDQALTDHVISSACSSFTIDWTYYNGVGAATNSAGTFFSGVGVDSRIEQPWFGLAPDFDNNQVADDKRGVYPYGSFPDLPLAPATSITTFARAQTILPYAGPSMHSYPNNIEIGSAPAPVGVQDYWAVFGYNQTRPLDPTTGQPWAIGSAFTYTPFPSAIRITMVLHDPDGRLEGGREFQFVVDLPNFVN